MEETEKAYLAGLVDGEGYISILRAKRGNKKKWSSNWEYQFFPVLKIAMTDEDIIRWLKEQYGGVVDSRKGYGNHKDSWCWVMKKKQVIDFLKQIYPYMRVKKQVAEKLFHYPSTPAGYNLTQEVYDKRCKLYAELRGLNKKGTA